jgi:hypothetical protein
MNKKKVIIEFDANTGEVVGAINKVNESLKETKEATEEAGASFGELEGLADKFSGGLIGGFKGAISSARNLAKGMTSLKAAVASTGIGLLVVALGALYTWMQTSEKGAKTLAKAEMFTQAFWKVLTDQLDEFISNDLTAFFEDPIGGIVAFGNTIKTYVYDQVINIINGLGLLGEAIILVFEGEFTQAAEKAKEGALMLGEGIVSLYPMTALATAEIRILSSVLDKAGDEMAKAMEKAESLAEIQFMLVEATKAYTVASAELQQTIDLEQKIIDDTTRSYEERTEALERQSKALEDKAKLDLQQAKLQESALRQEIAITANFEERKAKEQELAEAIAERIDKETQVQLVELDNAQKRREIDLEELERKRSINQQLEDLRVENIESERDQIIEQAELDRERALQELELLRASEEEKAAIMDEYREAERIALATFDAEQEIKNKELREKELEQEKALQDAKITIAKSTVAGIASLGEFLTETGAINAEKGFKVSKALGIAQATISTIEGVVNALTAKSTIPEPFGQALKIANATSIGLAGAVNIAKIKATKFEGGSPSPTTPSAGGGASSFGGGSIGPTVDFSFLEQGPQQNTVQAYVLEQNVSNSQEANQLIKDQAKL